MELTERQQREVDYHREHAQTYERMLREPFSYDVLEGGRWWNAYWRMFAYLKAQRLSGKRALVVGCGAGEDALRLAKLGLRVHAFDLSPESIEVAKKLAKREGLQIEYTVQPAEKLSYANGFFDVVVARDILHHVDIQPTIAELTRVSKWGALWVIDEIYSHSLTDRIRHSWLVEKALYPLMQKFVYQSDKPYITEDERKLTEADVASIVRPLQLLNSRYFCLFVQRVIPDSVPVLNKLDRMLLMVLAGLGKYLAGRVLITATCASLPAQRA